MYVAVGEHKRMDSLFTGIAGGAGTSGLISLGRWFFQRIRKEGADSVEEQRIEERDQDVRGDIRGLRDDLKSAISEFRANSVLTTELRSSQAVVNSMTAKTLDAIATKQDRHAELIADHSSTLKLLCDNVALLRQRIDQVDKEICRK